MSAPRQLVVGVLLVAAVAASFVAFRGPTHPTDAGPLAEVSAAVVTGGAFTIAVLPDSQYSALGGPLIGGRTAVAIQTRWLADHAEDLDLKFVLHEGDIVDTACSQREWDRAMDAIRTIDDAGISWAISAGNHDVRYYSSGTTPCTDGDPVDHPGQFNENFPLEAMSRQSTFGGSFSPTDGLNTFHTFEAGGVRFLVLALEFGARSDVLDWALQVTRDHPDHVAILLTHDLIGADGLLRGGDSTSLRALPSPPRLTGAEIWTQLVEPAPNIRLTLSGHVDDGTAARSVAPNADGVPVHRLLANYQTLGNGQTGHLRLLTIDPAAGTIRVRTYSPVADDWLSDDANDFTITDVW